MKFEPILSPYILLYKWCGFWNLHVCDRANILPLRGSIWGKNIVIPACWLDWHLLWGQFQQQMHLIFIYVYICGWKWWRDLTPPGWVIEHLPNVPWALYLLILVLLPYKDIWKLLFELIIFCSSMAFIWNCLLLAVICFCRWCCLRNRHDIEQLKLPSTRMITQKPYVLLWILYPHSEPSSLSLEGGCAYHCKKWFLHNLLEYIFRV